MYCKNCGMELSSDAKFCSGCGTAVNETTAVKETVASEEDSPSPKIEGNQQTNDDSSITLETSENSSEVAQTHSDEFTTEYEQDVPAAKVEPAKPNEILLTTLAGFGFKRGTLNLYNDKLEFSCPQGTYTYPINEIKKVRKSLGCLEVTTIDNKMVSFGYNGDIVDQWVAKIIRMIPEENLNRQNVNNTEPFTANNTDDSLQLSDIKEAGTEKAKEVIDNYKNIKKQPLLKKILYIAIPVIIIIVLINAIGGGGSHGSNDDYIGCAKTVVSKQLRSPGSAQWSNEKVVEKDDYGRVLVTLTVDSQNGFGAYLRSHYAVVIESYDKKTQEFTYQYDAVESWSDQYDFLEDACIEDAKKGSNWNEPLKEE